MRSERHGERCPLWRRQRGPCAHLRPTDAQSQPRRLTADRAPPPQRCAPERRRRRALRRTSRLRAQRVRHKSTTTTTRAPHEKRWATASVPTSRSPEANSSRDAAPAASAMRVKCAVFSAFDASRTCKTAQTRQNAILLFLRAISFALSHQPPANTRFSTHNGAHSKATLEQLAHAMRANKATGTCHRNQSVGINCRHS